MADLYSIPGITDADVAKFKEKGYATSEALWEKLREDKKGTLQELANHMGIPADRLAKLLAVDVALDAPSVWGGFIRRHWADLSVAVTAVLLFWGLFFWREPVAPDKLAGLSLIRVPLKQLPADATRKTPYRATLIQSPRATGEPVLEEVTVVEIDQAQVPSAALAVKPEQAPRIGRLLGTADLYILQRAQ